MEKKYFKLFLLFFALSFLSACSEEDDPDTVLTDLGGETWTKGPLDNWLLENFVTPYNIEVKYRFDRYELALDKTLVPPQEDKIIPALETIKKTWIAPYEQVAGPNFIKRLSPKQFVLVGSPEYNTDGTITLGTAEGGRKIVLYQINSFDKANKAQLKLTLRIIHHEFGHILHQTIQYPPEFKSITPIYTANWFDYPLADARSRGFITEYARNIPDDDFVEMIAIMMIEGRTNFDAIINNIKMPDPSDPTKTISNTRAQAALRQKEQIIVRYFKEAWNIDFYTLQTSAQTAINSL
ncbi:zinc-binding metallopeptidase [Adhaeribacter radiodurans]|uniref:Substrate import-associated zinc metallohydrolase lipoprotein n=1 Tax=Adhaeribacter radiodurans TaxID=2745197 RepID=A0A7L7LDS7_9BACT|nr:putative zinc-binding metallopeptidase [Adhaeribacter radiodurans]QMU30970.1 hypothetical protein HUW48_24405 [Adhaeribacter radiodurans]